MPKAPPPTIAPLKFHGRRDYPPEDAVDDWGLTPAQQASYSSSMRARHAGSSTGPHARHACGAPGSWQAVCLSGRHLLIWVRSVALGRLLQETYVEQFRRILVSKGAYKEGDHGEGEGGRCIGLGLDV